MTDTDTARALVDLDPATLIVGANVRLDARLDRHFIASIRERGVIEPIIAQCDEEGRAVVIAGQRRTLAAVEAGRATVPVVLTDRREEVDRIIDQMAENDHRAALTQAERIAAVEQLSLLGLTAAQVAKRAAIKRDDVHAALAVAKSTTAKDAVAAHTTLTLDQAAALADLETDPDVQHEDLTDVMRAIQDDNGIDFTIRRAQDERDERREKCILTEQANADGLRVVDVHWSDESTLALPRLVDADGNPLDPEAHATCPGHALTIERRWTRTSATTCEDETDDDECDEREPTTNRLTWVLAPVCVDWAKHGHRTRYGSSTMPKLKAEDMTDEQRAEAKAQRALVIRLNKDWTTATQVRTDWLTKFATRKTLPRDAGTFMAHMVTSHSSTLDHRTAHGMARTILGLGTVAGRGGIEKMIEKASDKRAAVIALAVALAACEGRADRNDWRNPNSTTALYLRTLQSWGYELAEVEQRAAGLWTEAEADEDDYEAEADEGDYEPDDEHADAG